jgi:hypothetical protein
MFFLSQEFVSLSLAGVKDVLEHVISNPLPMKRYERSFSSLYISLT